MLLHIAGRCKILVSGKKKRISRCLQVRHDIADRARDCSTLHGAQSFPKILTPGRKDF